MGDSEFLYVVLAILFFSGLNSSINKFLMLNREDILAKEFEYRAVAVAQEIIESAKTRNFDANLTEPLDGFDPDTPPTTFENPYSMTHGNETWPNFNDIDDFCGGYSNNGYVPFETTIETPRGNYDVSMIVYYVSPSNLEEPSYTRQYSKKLVVTVSNEHLARDITLEHVFSFIPSN